ncbi:unnamed protein product [Acanthoscelides obtectus]|uniref:Coiled-coil domain-containing protein 40 n=1 Tax=Acanthoscelides obtectus TaxID=200917 RepID=A0A9P0MFR9_ACAOB|nr:unnamed protein product [Acanthoscelides obtectus]CAK1629279.1 Coiled-coil domain-containing protein 40 [Acanthoscelides obtectus]
MPKENEKDLVPEKALLSPDHPLLEQFQKSLKEHLLNQINRLKDDIFEYETAAKKKNVEREELGVRAYEAQQIVCAQQRTLEGIISDLKTVTAAKEEIENELEEDKKKFKQLKDKLNLTEKSNRELQHEIEGVNMLIQQMVQLENKIESQISVNKRVAEKTRKDMLKEAVQKRDQDMLIYRLFNEIWRLEGEIESLNIQIKAKELEMDELQQTIAVGNTNIEALQTEYRCLMHSWNSVVVAISNRDKGLDCLTEELNKLKEKHKTLLYESDQLKKLQKKECNENERYTMIKSRIEYDIKNCKTQYDEETAKKASLDATMYELQTVIDQTEKDIEMANDENKKKEIYLTSLGKDYAKIMQKKHELEEKIMKDLEMRMANDKVARNMTKILVQMRAKKKDVEIIMNETENRNSMLHSQIESQKFVNDEQNRMLKEAQNQQAELTKEADQLQAEIQRYELLFRKKERDADVLNSKLERAAAKLDQESSPQEMVIEELEKRIEESQERIKKLQTFWLREQKNLLGVSNERQEQLRKINLMKKQLLILEQKNIKINFDIESYKKQEEQVQRNIRTLHNKSVIFCEALYKKRNHKVELDRNNVLLQNQIDTKLKDAELAMLQITSDIEEIEEDKVTLSKELIEVNREALEWDKKLQLAREAVNSLKDEQSKEGEVGNMRQEIHKMEVILSGMKRAQEKLIKDMEHCIARRDSIYMSSEAKIKKNNEDKTRVTFLRKLDNQRNKNKQLENEIESGELKIKEIDEKKKTVEEEIGEVEKQLQSVIQYHGSLNQELEETKTNRQFNFELLVAQQKKLQIYENLAKGRTPYTIYRKDSQIVPEYSKQKDLNNRLGQVVDHLMTDFPERVHELTRISNTLKIGALAIVNL